MIESDHINLMWNWPNLIQKCLDNQVNTHASIPELELMGKPNSKIGIAFFNGIDKSGSEVCYKNSEIFPWQSYLEYKLLSVGIPTR